VIPEDAKAAEAAGAGRPVTLTAPRGRAAGAVRELVAELQGAPLVVSV
jgi:MinD-like ATPase involved in chromosome partitioning or flagellar assembly